MSGYTWQLLEWFQRNRGQSQTRLAINSNLSFDKEKIDRLIEGAKEVELDIYTSNEACSTKAEYIRDGLDYQVWQDNVEYLLDSRRLRGLHVMCTINALCLTTLDKFLRQIMKWKAEYGKDAINFTLNILRFPSFQSPLVLPKDIRIGYANRLKLFQAGYKESMHEFENNQLTRLVEYLDVVEVPHSEAFEMPELLNDFKQFYTQYDERRGKNFAKTFPDLKEWYEQI